MKRLRRAGIGVDQGNTELFSEFADGGDMWTGSGARERRKRCEFSTPFHAPPAVHLSLSLWDFDSSANIRADLAADGITCDGFDIVFRTWSDSRVARVRVAWMAIGDILTEEDWDV